MAEPANRTDLAEEARLRVEVEEARASLDAGRGVPWPEVRRWIQSWGTLNELPPPECP